MRNFATIVLGMMVCCAAYSQYYGKNVPAPGQTRAATEAPGEIRIDQNLNQQVPLDVQLTDETGKTKRLGDFLGDKPVVLMLVFYQCRGICTDELQNVSRTISGFKSEKIGEHFDVLTVSIHPKETYEMAAAAKALYVANAKQPGAEKGWHFTVGTEAETRRLADAVGFRYTYDRASDNIVHPAGIMILTPQGKISQYMMGTEYPGQMMVSALRNAAKERIGFKQKPALFWSCVNIDPLTGSRSLNILNTLKVLGLLTVLCVGGWLAFMSFRLRKNRMDVGPGPNTEE